MNSILSFGEGNRGLIGDERGTAGHIEQSAIGGVTGPSTDRTTPFAVRREEIAGDCRVAYFADGPAPEVTFDAEHHLAHLIIIAAQKSVAQAVLAGCRRDDEGHSRAQPPQ